MAKRPVYSARRADPEKIEAVRESLIFWFRENGRDLPWRRTRDPWRLLVSEVMLQQIQIVRAVPFYERFLKRFPTVAALAGAPTAEAIQAWGDLGRCRRVVSLHRIVRIIAEEHGGEIPTDPETLIKLPAICPYTAGAVACFAGSRARVEARAALEQAEEVRRLWRTWVSGWVIRRRKKGRKTSPFALVKNGAFE